MAGNKRGRSDGRNLHYQRPDGSGHAVLYHGGSAGRSDSVDRDNARPSRAADRNRSVRLHMRVNPCMGLPGRSSRLA
jgi:hypothetical protein